jgi:hypothetical protein
MLPEVGGLKAVQAAQQCRFSRARRADDADHFALRDGQIDAFEYLGAAEVLAQVVRVDDDFGGIGCGDDGVCRGHSGCSKTGGRCCCVHYLFSLLSAMFATQVSSVIATK